jgi:hypothetical protein
MNALSIVRSRQTNAWGYLRHRSERLFGRGRIWNWLWDCEWQSLKRDRKRAERHQQIALKKAE